MNFFRFRRARKFIKKEALQRGIKTLRRNSEDLNIAENVPRFQVQREMFLQEKWYAEEVDIWGEIKHEPFLLSDIILNQLNLRKTKSF